MTDEELMDMRDRLHDQRKINRVEVLCDMEMLAHVTKEFDMEPYYALKAYTSFLDRYEQEQRMDKIQDIIKLVREKAEEDYDDDDCGSFCGCCSDDMY